MTRIALSLILLTGAATPALAERNELAFGGGSRSLRSDSANAVTENNLGGGELSFGRRLPIDLPQLDLWALASLGWGNAEGAMFQSIATDVSTFVPTVGASARYALHSHLTLQARVDLGVARTSLQLEGDGRTLSDSAWSGLTRGSLGIDAFALRSPRFSLGVRFEVGYVAASGAALAPREDQPDDDVIMLPVMDASIGTLDLGGRFFNVSILAGF